MHVFSAIFLLLSTMGFAAAPDKIYCVSPADGSTSIDTRSAIDPFVAHDTDLSRPLPILLQWHSDTLPKSSVCNVYFSENHTLLPWSPISVQYPDSALPLWNLKIGTRYFWQISIMDSAKLIGATKTLSFITPSLWPRMIFIDGATNVRDIGGRKNADGIMIPQGMFYRSTEFNQNHVITKRGIQQLLDLGVVFEIDLRNDWENAQAVLPNSVRYFRPPNPEGISIVGYREGLIHNAGQYRDVFKEIAKAENYPLICHCRAGADRTGTVCALLEAILGCTDRQIADDYQWTSLSVYGRRDTASSSWQGLVDEIKSYDAQHKTFLIGAWNYLLSKGLTYRELISIRTIFLNDTASPFPGADGSMIINKNPDVIRYASKSILIMLARNKSISVDKDVSRIEVFNVKGQKVWEYKRRQTGTREIAAMPLCGSGVNIVKAIHETSVNKENPHTSNAASPQTRMLSAYKENAP